MKKQDEAGRTEAKRNNPSQAVIPACPHAGGFARHGESPVETGQAGMTTWEMFYASIHSLISISVLLLYLLFAGAAGAADTEQQIAKIQKAYENIKDLKGSFIQKSTIRDLDKTETYKGNFFIKPPLKMKWEYKGKTAQDLTINNDTVLIYKKGEHQAYKSKFDRQTYGQTPVALLGGFGNIKDEFSASAKDDSIILKPKKPMGSVTSIKIKMSEEAFPIHSFTINDSYSNVIEIIISDVKINTGLRDSLFDLSLPKGVNIFEQ